MKKFIFLAAIAATVVASCAKEPLSKEENVKVKEGMIPYKAAVKFDATKSTIDGNKIVWVKGEKVAIFDGINAEPNEFTVVGVGEDGAWIEGEISEMAEKIYGVYPFSAAVGLTLSGSTTVGDSLTVTLPSTQTIGAGRVIASDALVTVSEEADPYGGYLLFYNPFSVLKFTVPVDGVKKVVFSGLDGKGVTGNQTVRVDDHANRDIVVKGDSSLTVSKADGFAKGIAYYATVFSRDVAGVRFVLTADDYASTIKSDRDASFIKNCGLTFNFTEDQINDGKALRSGEFSVSAIKKVKFTKSNLWWDGSEWHLEENQTDYPTSWNANHVGHFFWTQDAANSYTEDYPNPVESTSDKYFADGSDAGHMLTVDGQSGLYALSSTEWDYLFNSRTSGLHKYGVTVTEGGKDYTNCLIIAPDGYSGTALSEITDWSLSNINNLGLVCLPAGGYRSYNSAVKFWDAGNFGRCWAATPKSDNEAMALMMSFDDGGAYATFSEGRYKGFSIRLVSTVE